MGWGCQLTLESSLLRGASSKLLTTLDVAGLNTARLELRGTVGQVLLRVLEVRTADGLLLGVVMSWVRGHQSGHEGHTGDGGGETHDEFWGQFQCVLRKQEWKVEH